MAGTPLRAVTYGIAGMIASGDNGTILQSLDTVTWTQRTSGTTARLNAGVANSGGTYVFAGAGGVIVVSGDGGVSWTTPGTGLPVFPSTTRPRISRPRSSSKSTFTGSNPSESRTSYRVTLK